MKNANINILVKISSVYDNYFLSYTNDFSKMLMTDRKTHIIVKTLSYAQNLKHII